MRELRRSRSRQQLTVLRPLRGAAQRRAGITAGVAGLPGLRGHRLRQESSVLRPVRRTSWQNRSARSAGTRPLPRIRSSAPGAAPRLHRYLPGAPRAPAATAPPVPAPVVVKIRKGRLPVLDDPSGEWDPWSDGDPAFNVQMAPPQVPLQEQPQVEKRYAHLPLAADGPAQPATGISYQEAQGSRPRKKYSHLPLIADELKADIEHRAAPDDAESGGPGRKGRQEKKKGLFGFK